MKRIQFAILVLILVFGTISEAAFFRLDFAGLISNNNVQGEDAGASGGQHDVSGYIIIDTSIIGSPAVPGVTHYWGAWTEAAITIDSVLYSWDPIIGTDLFEVGNNTALQGDFVSTQSSFTSTASGESTLLVLQFAVFAADWFDGTEIPGSFDLGDVDNFSGTTSTFIYLGGGDISQPLIGDFTYAEFRPVPLPAAFFLFVSALVTLRACRAQARD